MFFISKASCPCVHMSGSKRLAFPFQGYCLVTGSMGQMISYRTRVFFLNEVMGEKRLKMGNKGAEVGRAERGEGELGQHRGVKRTVVQHFSILSFCLGVVQ